LVITLGEGISGCRARRTNRGAGSFACRNSRLFRQPFFLRHLYEAEFQKKLTKKFLALQTSRDGSDGVDDLRWEEPWPGGVDEHFETIWGGRVVYRLN